MPSQTTLPRRGGRVPRNIPCTNGRRRHRRSGEEAKVPEVICSAREGEGSVPQKLASMGRRSAYEQTAHVLCELLIRLRAVGLAPDNQYDLHMTQEDLADAFGISA